MKPIKSVATIALMVAALSACDRTNKNSNQSNDLGARQNEEVERGSNFSGVSEYKGDDRGAESSYIDSSTSGGEPTESGSGSSDDSRAGAAVTTRGTGASDDSADEAYDEDTTQEGTGAADEIDDEGNDEWKDKDNDNFREEEQATPASHHRIQRQQQRGKTKYLDNTSSEPDLRARDKGIPIGTEPSSVQKTSSEGNPNQM